MESTEMRRRLSEVAAPPGGWPSLASELVELRFFMSQGLFAEALELLSILKQRYPLHPALQELAKSTRPIRRPDTQVNRVVDEVLAGSASLRGAAARRAAPRWRAPEAADSGEPRTTRAHATIPPRARMASGPIVVQAPAQPAERRRGVDTKKGHAAVAAVPIVPIVMTPTRPARPIRGGGPDTQVLPHVESSIEDDPTPPPRDVGLVSGEIFDYESIIPEDLEESSAVTGDTMIGLPPDPPIGVTGDTVVGRPPEVPIGVTGDTVVGRPPELPIAVTGDTIVGRPVSADPDSPPPRGLTISVDGLQPASPYDDGDASARGGRRRRKDARKRGGDARKRAARAAPEPSAEATEKSKRRAARFGQSIVGK